MICELQSSLKEIEQGAKKRCQNQSEGVEVESGTIAAVGRNLRKQLKPQPIADRHDDQGV